MISFDINKQNAVGKWSDYVYGSYESSTHRWDDAMGVLSAYEIIVYYWIVPCVCVHRGEVLAKVQHRYINIDAHTRNEVLAHKHTHNILLYVE